MRLGVEYPFRFEFPEDAGETCGAVGAQDHPQAVTIENHVEEFVFEGLQVDDTA